MFTRKFLEDPVDWLQYPEMITYYCPRCWVELSSQVETCPNCGYQLEEYMNLTLEEKLVMALSHPVAENRMLAVQILGELRSSLALPRFEQMIADPSVDIYLLREIVKALSRIKHPRSRELLQRATLHQSPLIRQLAREQIQKMHGSRKKR